MKATKNLATSIPLLLISIFIFSCESGELSRGTAEKLIREKFRFPIDEIFDLTIEDWSTSAQLTAQDLKILEKEGLVTYKYDDRLFGGGTFGNLTEKGKQFARSGKYNKGSIYPTKEIDVKVAELDFGSITGIAQQKGSNIAKVEYTLIRKNLTPFGKVFVQDHRYTELKEQAINKSVAFTKYDDGGRINE